MTDIFAMGFLLVAAWIAVGITDIAAETKRLAEAAQKHNDIECKKHGINRFTL